MTQNREEMEKFINRRIKRMTEKVNKLKEEHGDKPSITHTYHGGWSLGYWEGRLSAFEEILDMLEEAETNK